MRTEHKSYGALPYLFTKALGFVCLMGLFIACHKDPIVDAKVPTQLVKTTLSTKAGINTETNYQYDIQGRLVRENQTNPTCPRCGGELGNVLNVYTYYKDKLTQADKVGHDNSLTGNHATYTLNKWGFAIADYLNSYNTAYTHDEDGFLLLRQIPSLTMPTQSLIIAQNIKDQNIIERSNNSGYEHETTTYEYDLNHLSLLNPVGFLEEGRQSHNLVTKETSIIEYRDGATLTVTTHYGYQFDKQDRITERRITIINPTYKEPIIRIESFEYSN